MRTLSDGLEGEGILWWVALPASVGVAVVALAGVAAGITGHFDGGWVLVVGAVAATAAAAAVRSQLPRVGRPDLPALLTLALAVAFSVTSGLFAAEHVLVDRDPGIYLTAAMALADGGSLQVDLERAAFGDAEGVSFSTGGWFAAPGDERLQPWFMHGLTAVLATVHDLAGAQATVRVPAVLGGLSIVAFGLVARRFAGPWPALGAAVVLAVSLVQVWLFRDTYSETLAQPLLWAGLAVLIRAWDRRSVGLSASAGVILAGAALTRLDSVALLLVPAGLWALARDGRERRMLMALLVPLLAGFGAWAGQLRWVNPIYLEAHRSEVTLMVAATATGAAVLVGAGRAVRWVSADVGRRRLLGRLAAAIVVVGVVGGLLRAPLTEVRLDEPWPAAAAVEAASGLRGEGLRTYAEQSLVWMTWYLGWAALALATLGGAWAARRAVEDPRLGRPLWIVALAAAPITVLYLWDPNAVPDHMWVMRRYAVAAIPLLLLGAALGLAVLYSYLRRLLAGHRLGPRLAAAVASFAAVVPAGVAVAEAAVTTAPMARHVVMDHHLGLFGDICERLPPDAVVLVVNQLDVPEVLSPGIRSMCSVPVGVLRSARPERFEQVIAGVRAAGGVPVVVGRDRDRLELALGGAELPDPLVVRNDRHPELRVGRPPSRLLEVSYAVTVVEVPELPEVPES